MFWGLTPALDLTEEYTKKNQTYPEVLNILIIGSTDCRHVLKTIARKYRHQKVNINFYIIETCMETVAKQLLLLYTALQPKESMGLEQKTRVFMELFGNTLVRPYTAKYLSNAANDLIKMITNYDYLKNKMGMVNIDIKYKDRDYIENLVKFWCGKDEFNIIDCWNRRLRKLLGVRYDSKLGAFDWDLHMRLHDVGGKQICGQEYRSFRLNGVAFSWLEGEVSKPNRSMVCAIIPNGENYLHHGYLGDMQTGPFVAYGLECEDKTFLKSTNGQNAYRATDITQRNLKQIFYEMEHQQEYEHIKTTDIELGGSVFKQDKLVFDTKGLETNKLKPLEKCIQVDDVCINFVSICLLDQMKYKEQYHGYFDLVYCANNFFKYFDVETMEKVAKSGSVFLFENQLFLVNNRKKQMEEYAETVQSKINEMNVKKTGYNFEKDAYFKTCLK
ncbi:dynein assembly factor 3, axonemal homolog [Sitophilus oryzae]|uniref:Dynein assembly factor 3, axonemal homolog n=1 Tax=Sitophilus oryzae TaxID=7048 RepID=A0A6J2YW01_SITOR|nr:dynein assembly factor 3, axonemal homolog [Sitophilus oryzae]